MTIAEVMDAIADQLDGLTDDFPGLQVSGRMLWNPTPPAIDVYPAEPFQEPLTFGRDDWALNFTVRARVNTPDHEGAQELLLAMMDPNEATSVAKAITAAGTASPAKTLDGAVENVVVDGPSDYGFFVDPGSTDALLGCTWNVRVIP